MPEYEFGVPQHWVVKHFGRDDQLIDERRIESSLEDAKAEAHAMVAAIPGSYADVEHHMFPHPADYEPPVPGPDGFGMKRICRIAN